MYKDRFIDYNLILKMLIIFMVIYGLLKLVPIENMFNKDLFLIIIIILISFYFINLI
jgi:hypothetical protein